MGVLKSIDKVLAAFGNIRAMERLHVDSFTENLITNISGVKIAESLYGQLFVSFQTLADYEFMNVSILSATDIKTYKGCSLTFLTESGETMVMISDTKEIESDYSNVSNRWLTKISFVIEAHEKKFVIDKNFDKVFLKFKKKTLPLTKCD
ncbi:hypothetical protein [Seonamhaeicola marinus]|uniref:Uncharacterized protein n=1 Tax=Seonamhaeicola marinus TaxID=1912246 RepID=A0A5D0HQA9_9FLAO|nr:hypothetical protein [Seonamhaeicola marinus]TYA71562.1 hypothetical protein FUA24_18465 [Seonamhaeicola marinus]